LAPKSRRSCNCIGAKKPGVLLALFDGKTDIDPKSDDIGRLTDLDSVPMH
jgi:hypothetical protein